MNDTTDEIRFCPSCGHEGNDVICPACNEKMESLTEEVAKVPDEESKKRDVFDDTSLEAEQEKEEQAENDPEED